MEHIKEVFRCEKINWLSFEIGFYNFSLESIKQVFEGLNVDVIRVTYMAAPYGPLIVDTFPLAKKLSFQRNPDVDAFKILEHECEFLKLGLHFRARIDGVKRMRAKNIHIYNPIVCEGTKLNAIVRDWISGSNPNLKTLGIRFRKRSNDYMETTMKGILHAVASIDIEPPVYIAPMRAYDGIDAVYDIENVHGKKAKIVFDRGCSIPCFKLIVSD